MPNFINSSWKIGNLTLAHRLIQGPLAGYSCAPFRELFNQFTPPAYCVSEMSSAIDVIKKHSLSSRYIYRSPAEKILAYQISGNEPYTMADAAAFLQSQGADLIDMNCGCPKTKIRKKGAGSALLDEPEQLQRIIKKVREALTVPLTVKIRIQGSDKDFILAQIIEDAGADAIIVHGRRWTDDYAVACDLAQIGLIKQKVTIPVIANGDINSLSQLNRTIEISGCDGFMIARAGCGKPWLFEELLEQKVMMIPVMEKIALFMRHLQGLATLENEYKAVLQSKSLIRYYFKNILDVSHLNSFYQLTNLKAIHHFLSDKNRFNDIAMINPEPL